MSTHRYWGCLSVKEREQIGHSNYVLILGVWVKPKTTKLNLLISMEVIFGPSQAKHTGLYCGWSFWGRLQVRYSNISILNFALKVGWLKKSKEFVSKGCVHFGGVKGVRGTFKQIHAERRDVAEHFWCGNTLQLLIKLEKNWIEMYTTDLKINRSPNSRKKTVEFDWLNELSN